MENGVTPGQGQVALVRSDRSDGSPRKWVRQSQPPDTQVPDRGAGPPASGNVPRAVPGDHSPL